MQLGRRERGGAQPGSPVANHGSVTTHAIDLTVSDDGAGFREDRAGEARRAGHFGLDSMGERAEAVAAQTTVTNVSDGVAVRFDWERPS